MGESQDMGDPFTTVPWHFTQEPLLKDTLRSPTSVAQVETVAECLPFLVASHASTDPFDFDEHGLPNLFHDEHIDFLQKNLKQFPAAFVGIDASRPWMVYWALMGLYLLGEDVAKYRTRVLQTLSAMQNKSGGFGGGKGQYSHLAGTYPSLLALALVGGEESYCLVDRKSMWQWLGRLKQADGGFQVCEGGEEDVRGAYCALVAISLFNLPLELPPSSPARKSGLTTFLDQLGPYLSQCQTYEGGISSAPGHEAHGAYAFCAIACLCLLDKPEISVKRYLDVDSLLRWLSSRQYAPEGGFAGRTNKLVDGCYNHWIGGCWPLLQAVLAGPQGPKAMGSMDTIYSVEGLARYILCCAQAEHGGLRDKPSKRPDSYHTCYNLAGLSTLEHRHHFEHCSGSHRLASATSWKCQRQDKVSKENARVMLDEESRVRSMHPVYVIPHDAVQGICMWAERQKFVQETS